MLWLEYPYPPLIFIQNVAIALVDILIITFIFYQFYKILAQTKAVQVIKGLALFLVLYLIAQFGNFATFSWLLDQISSVIVVAIIVLFQPELRRVLTQLGQSRWVNTFLRKDPRDLSEIILAVEDFNWTHTGALIVFEKSVGLKNYIERGTIINAKISSALLRTIFFEKTALHDGAVIIKSNLITSAGCYLPLSDSMKIDKDLGTRHRAALGIAEETDAVVVVVSEETGRITLAYDGQLIREIHGKYIDGESLKKRLSELMGYEEDEAAGKELMNAENQ